MSISSLIKDLGAPAPGAVQARKKSIAAPKEPRGFNQALSEAQKRSPVERLDSVQRQSRRDATPVRRNEDDVPRRDERLASERDLSARDKIRPDTPARAGEAPGRNDKVKSDKSESSVKDSEKAETTSPAAQDSSISETKSVAEKGEAEKAETVTATLIEQVQQTLAANQSAPVQTAFTEAPPVETQVAALLAVPGIAPKQLKSIEELPAILVDEDSSAADVGAIDATAPAVAAVATTLAATPKTIEQPESIEADLKIGAEASTGSTVVANAASAASVATASTKHDTDAEANKGTSTSIEQTGKAPLAESRDAGQSPLSAIAKEAAQLIEQVKSTASGSAVSAVSAPVATEQAQAAKPSTPAESLARADSPVPLQAVAIEIGLRAVRGAKEFAIRLDPEELGRVDIKLEISEAGEVQAKLVVDRVETLQLLQRDAKTLERAFDQAGLKTNPDGLQFSLRDPGQQNRNGQQHDQQQNGRPSDRTEFEKPIVDDVILRPFRFRGSAVGGLDISI